MMPDENACACVYMYRYKYVCVTLCVQEAHSVMKCPGRNDIQLHD